MNAPSPSPEPGRTRRLVVTVVIATATAAVTAGVVLNERRPAEAAVERVGASPAVAGGSVAPAASARRRVEWRDPWKRPAPLSESAPPSSHDAADAASTRSDPSLPPAADALGGVDGLSGEPAPTF